MAHKKAGGSSRNGRDSNAQRLGVKKFGGEHVIPGNIIVRQRGTRWHPGTGVGIGKDHTIFAVEEGQVKFQTRVRRADLHLRRRRQDRAGRRLAAACGAAMAADRQEIALDPDVMRAPLLTRRLFLRPPSVAGYSGADSPDQRSIRCTQHLAHPLSLSRGGGLAVSARENIPRAAALCGLPGHPSRQSSPDCRRRGRGLGTGPASRARLLDRGRLSAAGLRLRAGAGAA